MNKKLSIFFIVCLLATTALIYQASQWFDRHQRLQSAHQAKLLHEGIEERFELLLEAHLSVGVLAARYLSEDRFDPEDYQVLCQNIVSLHEEIVGVNILAQNGEITHVCPWETNQQAKGRISQNLEELKVSFKRGEKFWFSGPFELYQPGEGFVFYIPLTNQNNLTGWFALTMTFEKFFGKFNIATYLQNYHLIIRDDLTRKNFFASAKLPSAGREIYKSNGQMFGRDITFLSWDINPVGSYEISLIFCLLISLLISGLATYSLKVHNLRKHEKEQLVKINGMLDFTAKEASSALNSIDKQLQGNEPIEQEQIAGFIFYLNNLLNQLSTTNVLSKKSVLPEMKLTALKPLLQEQIELIRNEIDSREINLRLDNSSLDDIRITSHKWLVSHSVLGNILRYIICVAPHGSDLQIMFFRDGDSNVLSFHGQIDDIIDPHRKELLSRGLEIAGEVISLSGGELSIIEKGNDTTIALQFK